MIILILFTQIFLGKGLKFHIVQGLSKWKYSAIPW